MALTNPFIIARQPACTSIHSAILIWNFYLSVRLSVCPSNADILLKWLYISSNFSTVWYSVYSHRSSFSKPSRRYKIPKEALNTGVRKNCVCVQYRRLSGKQYQIRPHLLQITNRKTQVTLSDDGRHASGPIFSLDIFLCKTRSV